MALSVEKAAVYEMTVRALTVVMVSLFGTKPSNTIKQSCDPTGTPQNQFN